MRLNHKGIIFDLDGTLLDTLADLADSVNHVLKANGFPVRDLNEYRYLVGQGARVLIMGALPDAARDDVIVERLQGEFVSVYRENWNVNTRPYEGIPDLLDSVVRSGLKIAILSNKPDDFTRQCVRGFLNRWMFDMILGQTDSLPRKPDPTGAFLISDTLDIPPSEFLYLGDTGIDMETAKSAGMFSVGALWGFREASELLEYGADALIERPEGLLQFL